jgi:TonB-linked SusC/RagA family outer membrane protein
MKKVLLLLLVVIGFAKANAQGQSVRGRVLDQNDRPLPGATVTLRGTTVNATTDTAGYFQINTGTQVSPVLVVSFIGYLNREFPVRGRSDLTISLEQDSKTLGDVIVVGYGVQKKSDVTGASSSVKAAEIAKRPLVRLESALQGTTSGVAVTTANGQPGTPPRVKIRGANSITGSTEPLYVIDGNIGSGSDVNPNDVESLEILKDAASTAIYGSRASNGVVLITTKSGGAGKARIGFSAWTRNDQIPRELSLMKPYDFALAVNNQNVSTGGAPAFSDQQLADFKSGAVKGTDWQKALQKKPWVQNYQLDLSGGSDAVRYYFSMAYLDQPGIILNQSFKRTSFRGNIDVKVNDRFNVKFLITASIPQGHNNDYGGGLGDPFNLATEWDPTSPIKRPDGTYVSHSSFGSIQYNPIANAVNRNHNTTFTNLSNSVILNYKLFRDLTFTSTNVYGLGLGYEQDLDGPGTAAYDNGSDNAVTISNRNRSYLSSNYLTFKHTWGDHSLTATALYELTNGQNNLVNATARKLSSYSLGYYGLGLGATQQTNATYTQDALVSWMGRVFYSYKDKYTLSASMRADGSSHLTNKWSSFPSVGLAWNMKREKWLQDSKIFSDFKLRASYGQTGNQAVPAYSTIQQFNVGGTSGSNQYNYYYTGGTPTGPGTPSVATSVGNPVTNTLKWEIKKTYDAGVDLAFLNSRLTFTADAYHSNVTNLIYNRPASQIVGGGNYQANIGSLTNEGVEFAVGGTPIVTRNIRWNTNFNISFNRNRITSLGGLDNIQLFGGNNTYSAELKVGQPLGEFVGYKFLGTWKTSEAAQAAAYKAVPGDAKYLDLNKDNAIDANDYVPLGNATPKYTYGFINDIGYKAFTLSFMFQGQQGSQVFSQTLAYTQGGQGDINNPTSTDAEVQKLWSPQHETNTPAWSKTGVSKNNSSRFVYNSSYTKLKNLSLTYRVPDAAAHRMKLNYLEVYVSGQNLWTITPYKGYDPEVDQQPTGNAISQGQEFGIIPNPKSYTVGLRLSL